MFQKLRSNWDHLLFYKWLVINFLGCSFLGLAYLNGWIHTILAADTSNIVVLIAGLFLFGFIATGYKCWKLSKELNAVKNKEDCGKYKEFIDKISDDNANRIILALQMKILGRINFIRYIATLLVQLGLIGTVVGFIMVLTGISADQLSDGVDSVKRLIPILTTGMGVALYTTLVGSILNIWLRINYQFILSGSTALIANILEHEDIEVNDVELE